MEKDSVSILKNAPAQTGANNNTKPKVFADAVAPEYIREIRSRCADFVATMKSCDVHDHQLISGFLGEIERMALESNNVDLLISKMRLYISSWENYEHIDHDVK